MNTIISFPIIFLTLSFLFTATAQQNISDEYPTLRAHGNTYTSACTLENKKELLIQLTAALPEKASRNDAWKLIDMLLCQKISETNRHRLASITPKKIPIISGGTGAEIDTIFIERHKEIDTLFADRKAWEASIGSEENLLFISYIANEACVVGKTLKLIRGKWNLISMSQGCD
jgi:hypothetical protein